MYICFLKAMYRKKKKKRKKRVNFILFHNRHTEAAEEEKPLHRKVEQVEQIAARTKHGWESNTALVVNWQHVTEQTGERRYHNYG